MFAYGIVLAVLVLALDQATKLWATHSFECCDYITPVTPFFNLVLVYNPGISFGLLSNLMHGQLILSAITSIIVAVLCYLLYQAKSLLLSLALGSIIGGAIGNIIDRVRIGSVIDFLDFYANNYHWPAFNIADAFIFIGASMLVVDMFLESKKER